MCYTHVTDTCDKYTRDTYLLVTYTYNIYICIHICVKYIFSIYICDKYKYNVTRIIKDAILFFDIPSMEKLREVSTKGRQRDKCFLTDQSHSLEDNNGRWCVMIYQWRKYLMEPRRLCLNLIQNYVPYNFVASFAVYNIFLLKIQGRVVSC